MRAGRGPFASGRAPTWPKPLHNKPRPGEPLATVPPYCAACPFLEQRRTFPALGPEYRRPGNMRNCIIKVWPGRPVLCIGRVLAVQTKNAPAASSRPAQKKSQNLPVTAASFRRWQAGCAGSQGVYLTAACPPTAGCSTRVWARKNSGRSPRPGPPRPKAESAAARRTGPGI